MIDVDYKSFTFILETWFADMLDSSFIFQGIPGSYTFSGDSLVVTAALER